MKALTRTAALFAVAAAVVVTAGCERLPMDTKQIGYRGLAMESVINPRTAAVLSANNQMPVALPATTSDPPMAKDIYQNIKVLNDLSLGEFTRVMLAMNTWIAPPEQGCNYCHVPDNLADDSKYQKVVARRMLEMTRDINTNWTAHVVKTGVTCYTCHRGQPIPSNVWFQDPGPKRATGMLGNNAGQNSPGRNVGLTAMQFDPFTPFLKEATPVRIASGTALPAGNRASIQQTEQTYGLMVHMSKGLGVNCTFCHDSRNFRDWTESTPQRAVSWYGIRMARALNNTYLEPLTSTFPASRRGPLGDVAKINCATCHQGVNKPMYGAQMVADYPELRPVKAAPAAAPEAAPAAPAAAQSAAVSAPVAAVATRAGAGSGG
jgi:photosynthetic reaction center cytochrome c subunit